MEQTQPALVANDIYKRFPVKKTGQIVQAVAGVSMEVSPGSLTALVGPDGAGKTTLLRMFAGLIKPDDGHLQVLDVNVVTDPQTVQDRISYMPQRFGLYEDLSVQENLDLYADLHGVPQEVRGQRYRRLLEMTDLIRFTGRPAGKLSGGMKQKLGLACTLVRSPELLLLDEPTVGVDPLSRQELWEIIGQLIDEEQLTVLITTAYLDEAERCTRIHVLEEGKLLAEGPPDEIRQHARDLCFVTAPHQGQPSRVLQAQLLDDSRNIIDAGPQSGAVRFIRRPHARQQDIDALLSGIEVIPVEARLEDGFMVLLREQRQMIPPDTLPFERPALSATTSGENRQSDEKIIEVRDLVRKFGDFIAVDHVSFSVRRGEIFGLLGPNGAGKTTTFRMLCGLLPASSGFLQVAGINLRHARAPARRRIGYVAQKFALYSDLTVRENLEFFGNAYGLFGERLHGRIQVVIQQFDLAGREQSPSGQLPGGFRQRLAMAVGLLHEPEILFLDEPTSGIDPLRRRGFWRHITALSKMGTTIIITTHFMEEAEYCDRIVIQDNGRLVAMGTPHEVRGQAGGKGAMLTMEEAFIRIVTRERERDKSTERAPSL
jgi:ABC-2 type transport system ATP-binding protein